MLIKKEEQVITDINSLQADNAREQAKLYYEANKEEIWVNTLREKDKEIDRLNNIIKGIDDIIKNHYIVGHTVQNGSLDSILKEIKELKKGEKRNGHIQTI